MQLPMILRLRRAPEPPAAASQPVEIRPPHATSWEADERQAERERRIERYMRSRGIWDTFLHMGGGNPTIRR